MLDRLGGSDEPGVESGHAAKLLHDFRTLVSNAIDRFAALASRRLADNTEDAGEAFDLALGLPKVLVEGCSQLLRLCRLRHLGQCLDDLVFSEVDVLERLVEEVAQLLLRPARATRRRLSFLRSFRHRLLL